MQLQKQKHCLGCGVACIAMITGKAYDEIKKVLFGVMGEVEPLSLTTIKNLIHGSGIHSELWSDRYKTTPVTWPPVIGGPHRIVEIVMFPDSRGTHMITVDEKGVILDPLFGLHGSSYHKAVNMLTITKRETE